ncbi:MAG: porin family protein [Salinivirgaceae bacterium]|jgi:hypothetical protein|nr:porin family protein [Salinivirgaceae bacterium]
MCRIRIFIIVSLLVVMLSEMHAQEFNAGLYSGIVASQVDGDTHAGYHKAGLVVGGYVNRFLNKDLAGQMGLRYIGKGSKRADDKMQIYYKTQFHYVEMPFTLRYFNFSDIDLDIEGGIAVGYLIKGLEAKNNDLYLEDAEPPFNDIDLSALAGLNYSLNDKFTIGAHFSYSLMPIRAFFPNLENIKGGQYNNVLSFILSYKLSSWR